MVDFQSRNRSRGLDGRDDDDGDDPGEGDGDEVTEAVDAGEASGEAPGDGADASQSDSDGDSPTTGVGYAVVTVAAGRSLEDDPAGEGVVEAVESGGDGVATRELLAPSYDGIQTAVSALVDRSDVDAVVTVGGTGVEPADVTVDAVAALFEKRLPGFGELFRALSHDHEGTAVVRTRATAGVVDSVPVFCLPGDTAAARRGVEEIVLAEAPDLVAEASDDESPG